MAAVISCTSLVASANNVDVPSNVLNNADNGGISTLDWKKPSGSDDNEASLPYTAEPYPIYAGKYCYTEHYFKTSTGKLTLNYQLYAVQPAVGERSVEFELLKGTKFLGLVSWSKVDAKSISFTDTVDEDTTSQPHKTYDGTVTFSNLEKDTMYCICINNTSKKEQNPEYGSENAVCGTIIITE